MSELGFTPDILFTLLLAVGFAALFTLYGIWRDQPPRLPPAE